MFGDVLRERVWELQDTTLNPELNRITFSKKLLDIAVEDIAAVYPDYVYGPDAESTYLDILVRNEDCLPAELMERNSSLHERKYKTVNRNMWSSNNPLCKRGDIIFEKEYNTRGIGQITRFKYDTNNMFAIVKDFE